MDVKEIALIIFYIFAILLCIGIVIFKVTEKVLWWNFLLGGI